MRRARLMEATCPIARALDEIGDWWTLLIVRDAFGGKTRFSEFQKSLGLAKNILTERLRTLVENGILEKRLPADGGARSEYFLTDKGRQLRVILFALRQWGEDNLFEDGEEMMLARDRGNRPIARLSLLNADGESLAPESIVTLKGQKKPPRKTAGGLPTLT